MTEDEKRDTYGDPKLIYSSYYELNDDVNKDNYTYQEYIEAPVVLVPETYRKILIIH